MPLKARLVVAAWAGAYLLLTGGVVAVAFARPPFPFAGWCAAVVMATIAALLVDAFHPQVALFIDSIHRLPQTPGRPTIALTFDDGPVEPYTRQILDVLDRFDVKGSFFCIGENVQRNPALALEILRRGHTLGNHTYSHRTLLLAGPATIARELDAAEAVVRERCGVGTVFFRCPKGYKNPLVAMLLRRRRLRLVGYGYPIWDVQNPPPAELVRRVLSRARAGDVIVMHDGHPPHAAGRRDSLVAALPAIIEGLLVRGIRPVSLNQAFEPPA